MRRGVLWDGTICFAKKVGFVAVFVALLCVVFVDLLEGNRSLHKETSYGIEDDLTSQFIEENAPTLYNLKICEYQQKRACPFASSYHWPAGSPSAVKRSPVRALLTLPEELEISYTRPSRKLADIGAIFSGGGQGLLIGVIVITVVVTLGLFAFFLYCYLGRDALKPAANANEKQKKEEEKEEEEEEEEEEDDLVVNIRSKGYKAKLGTLQRSMRVTVRDPKIKNLLDSVDESGTTSLPLPPGKLSIFSPPASSSSSSSSPPPPPPPPPPGSQGAAPPPPPPPSGFKAPPPPPTKGGRVPNNKPSSSGSPRSSNVMDENNKDGGSSITQTKLKPFFWDKVNAAQNRSMVWHHLKDGSFQFDEETMVGLFANVAAQNKKERGKIDANLQTQTKLVQIIDSKKSQNLAILLKALNVTTEQVCDAVKKGTQLPVELIATLLKMQPTEDEELKLRVYNGDINQLGTSERFLKNLVEIPSAFKRLEVLLFMGSLHENYHVAKESFATLEVACNKLTSSRLFLKLLEAVLKTGNRMNDGTYRGGAQAFKLDTLLKLSDVKGTDGKTTLLSFVVQEIIRYEGIKVAKTRGIEPNEKSPEYLKMLGMEVVSKLSEELNDVKKAAIVDGEMLTSTVSKLGNMLTKTKEFMGEEMTKAEGATEFNNALTQFMQYAEANIKWMIEEEKRIMALVKSTADYFHGKSGKDEGLRLFAIVRDFLKILDNTCNEVRKTLAVQTRLNQKDTSPRKPNKQYWKSTRYKIMIMKDAVRMILDAIYDDDEAEQTQVVEDEPAHASNSPYLPSIHDKLALLAINNQQNGSDSDSDQGWSSDDDETKHNEKQLSLESNNNNDNDDQTVSREMKNKMGDSDHDRSSDDEEKKPRASDEKQDGELVRDADSEQPFPTDLEVNDSDAVDKELNRIESKLTYSPEPPPSVNSSPQSFADADVGQLFPTDLVMNDSDADDEETRLIESESRYSPEQPASVDTSRHSFSDSEFEQAFPTDLGMDVNDEDTRRIESESDYSPEAPASVDTSRHSFSDADCEQPFPTDLGLDANNKETRQIESESDYSPEAPASVDTSRHSFSDADYEQPFPTDLGLDANNKETRQIESESDYSPEAPASVDTSRHSFSDADYEQPFPTDLGLDANNKETRQIESESDYSPEAPASVDTSRHSFSDADYEQPFPTDLGLDANNKETRQIESESDYSPEAPSSVNTSPQSFADADIEQVFPTDLVRNDSDADDDERSQIRSGSPYSPEPNTSANTSRQSFADADIEQLLSDAIKRKDMDGSDADYWHEGDASYNELLIPVVKDKSQQEAQYTPESSTSEKIPGFSDAEGFNEEPMSDSDVEVWSSDDDDVSGPS